MGQAPPTPDPSGSTVRSRRRAFLAVAIAAIVALVAVVLVQRAGTDGEDGADGRDLPGATGDTATTDDDGTSDGTAATDGDGAGDDPAAGPDATDAGGTAADGQGGPAPDPVEGLAPSEPGTTTDPATAAADAQRSLERFLEVTDGAYQDPHAPFSLEGLAVDAAVAEVDASLTEFRASGYRQRGRVQLEEVSTLEADLDVDPPSITLAACIDATAVAIEDVDGQEVRGPSPTARSLHHYRFSHLDGRWQVARHEFPDDTTC